MVTWLFLPFAAMLNLSNRIIVGESVGDEKTAILRPRFRRGYGISGHEEGKATVLKTVKKKIERFKVQNCNLLLSHHKRL